MKIKQKRANNLCKLTLLIKIYLNKIFLDNFRHHSIFNTELILILKLEKVFFQKNSNFLSQIKVLILSHY